MKKRTPQGIALLLLLSLSAFLVNKYVINKPETLSIGGALNIKAHEMNKNLPIDLDEYTRLDKTVYIPEKQFQFNYTLHNLTIDSFSIKTLVDSTGPELLKTIKQDPSLKLLKENNVIFAFQYSDTLGKMIHKFTFKPTDYK